MKSRGSPLAATFTIYCSRFHFQKMRLPDKKQSRTINGMTLLIDQNGKLEIPKQLREALHLEPGSQVQAEQVGETIVLSAAKPTPELKRVGKLLMWTGEVGTEMKDAVEKIRENRTREVGGF